MSADTNLDTATVEVTTSANTRQATLADLRAELEKVAEEAKAMSPTLDIDKLAEAVDDIKNGVAAHDTAHKLGIGFEDYLEAIVNFGVWVAQSQRRNLAEHADTQVTIPPGYPRESSKSIRAIILGNTEHSVLARHLARVTQNGEKTVRKTHLSSFLWIYKHGYVYDYLDGARDHLRGEGGIPAEATLELLDLLAVAREDLVDGAYAVYAKAVEGSWMEAVEESARVRWAAQGAVRRFVEQARKAAGGNEAAGKFAVRAAERVAEQIRGVVGANLDDFVAALADAGQALYSPLWEQYRPELVTEVSAHELRSWLRDLGVEEDADRLVGWAQRAYGDPERESAFEAALKARAEGDPTWESELARALA